jgi:tyrosyl-tRNA synthetase
MTLGLVEELKWRGLLHQTTAGEAATIKHLSTGVRTGYCGFDPTKDSLTIGGFIAIKLLMQLQRAGHKPIVLMGGGTGMIGDPSGKDAERTLMTRDEIDANVAGQRRILEKLLDFSPGLSNAATIVNNADWLSRLGFIEVLRDVGKHFSVNAMIQRDSVKQRLEAREQGISYTEFSYMLLQAYDFLHLRRTANCSLQLAGSDQYGNIVSGVDLIHHTLGREGEHTEAFGITSPLVTRSDGKKMGKSERGAIFLSADRTSPYALYQYFVNVEDADVVRFLKWFTFLDEARIGELAAEHEAAPQKRAAHKALAAAMTQTVHGVSERERAERASEALFSGDVRGLDDRTLAEVFADVPSTDHARVDLGGEGLSVIDLVATTSLATSKREARQFLQTGAIAVNGEKVGPEHRLRESDLLHGTRILLRRGKKQWHATRWQ